MQLIPAIDLKNGQCVRLKQGLMEQATVFSDRPADTAAHWLAQGARRLHLVDLDGAFAGQPQNRAAVRDILAAVGGKMPVQLGGGIRDLHTIEAYVELGLQDVIIGT
ncbi:MAG: HisA/HisF-related TIM barrel protein, partial [Conchiformibius sp.]|nr:HisA/HisF-related TIM barrel protein [Conchiformibius sp.]